MSTRWSSGSAEETKTHFLWGGILSSIPSQFVHSGKWLAKKRSIKKNKSSHFSRGTQGKQDLRKRSGNESFHWKTSSSSEAQRCYFKVLYHPNIQGYHLLVFNNSVFCIECDPSDNAIIYCFSGALKIPGLYQEWNSKQYPPPNLSFLFRPSPHSLFSWTSCLWSWPWSQIRPCWTPCS